jgi:hypothetical protein
MSTRGRRVKVTLDAAYPCSPSRLCPRRLAVDVPVLSVPQSPCKHHLSQAAMARTPSRHPEERFSPNHALIFSVCVPQYPVSLLKIHCLTCRSALISPVSKSGCSTCTVNTHIRGGCRVRTYDARGEPHRHQRGMRYRKWKSEASKCANGGALRNSEM